MTPEDFSVRAGTVDEAMSPTGTWAFVDLGFSRAGKTCGWLLEEAPDSGGPGGGLPGLGATGQGTCLTFAGLRQRLRDALAHPGPPLHLVLEAPLSSAFDADGNPVGRDIERVNGQTRYWYVGLGCSVLVAALVLLEDARRWQRRRELRLFEGFVSFKTRGSRSRHDLDVLALRAVLTEPGAGAIVLPRPLDDAKDATMMSPLRFHFPNIGIAPVLIAKAP